MYKNNFKTILLGVGLFSALSVAANLNVVVKYERSGGIVGALNQVGDTISTPGCTSSGVNICPVMQTNANNMPGCDMENDVGFNDGGTPENGSDDSYDGDLIVRTNDAFNIVVDYSVNAGDEEVTVTNTLPFSFAYDKLPSFCKTGSSLNNNNRELVCALGNIASGTAQGLVFQVNVGAGLNGELFPVTSFEVSGPNSTTVSDDTNIPLVITAAARVNLRKAKQSVVVDDSNATGLGDGWRVKFKYYIDISQDANDSDPFLGSVGSVVGGTSTSWIDEASGISANATLIGCDTASAYAGSSSDPFNHDLDGPADRTLLNSGSLTSGGGSCIQSGGAGSDVDVNLVGADLSFRRVPRLNRNGGLLPANIHIAAIGALEFFVPASDANGTGQIPVQNCMSGFAPIINGHPNFAGAPEDTCDNCVALTLDVNGNGNGGNFSKDYRKSADPIDKTPPGHGPGEASAIGTGDGFVAPSEEFATQLSYRNPLATNDTNMTAICDVIDASVFELVDITATPGSAVVTSDNYPNADITIEYANGYINPTWPPAAGDNALIARECNSTSITWYPTTSAALANGPITKIRATYSKPFSSEEKTTLHIKHRALGDFANTGTAITGGFVAGESIPQGHILANWAVFAINNSYHNNNYDPKMTMTAPHTGREGDRVGLSRALVRIDKETDQNDTIQEVQPLDEFDYILKPTFTTSGPVVPGNVSIVDILPVGLNFVGMTSAPALESGYPIVCTGVSAPDGHCTQAGDTILFWDLGEKIPNQPLAEIRFTVQVDITANDGEIFTNRVIISSPLDGSIEAHRDDERPVNVNLPRGLLINKTVDEDLFEITDGPFVWNVILRNTTSGGLSGLDIIDVLPFNGDANIPFGAGNFVVRNPESSYSGGLDFVSAQFTNLTTGLVCGSGGAGEIYYYTNTNPLVGSGIDMNPLSPANILPGKWCQGTASGPDASCGYTNSGVTAIRMQSGNTMTNGELCQLQLITMPVPDANGNTNQEGDIYANNAGASGDQLSLPVASNDVQFNIFSGSIGDYFWFDANKNGLQDVGERPVFGATVRLYSATDTSTPLATTTTNPLGLYLFDNLIGADYVVEFIPPSGYEFTTRYTGDSAFDSNADPVSGLTDTISLSQNEDIRHVDAGLIENPIVPPIVPPTPPIEPPCPCDDASNDSASAFNTVMMMIFFAGTLILAYPTLARRENEN